MRKIVCILAAALALAGTSASAVNLNNVAIDKTVYRSVEQMPQFPGGERGLMKYLQQNITYPTEAAQEGVEGRVVVQFVVQADGYVGDVEVVRSVHPSLDNEAIRVIKALPRFTPGHHEGKPVNVWYILPVQFKLPEEEPEIHTTDELADNTTTSTSGRTVYRSVEQMPQFPGGEAGIMKFLRQNIIYPKQAADNNVQGRVVVQFVVQADGSIGEVKVVRSIDQELDNEAVRVIKTLPRFTPGREGGKPVDVWYTLPVQFKLQEKTE